MKHLRKLHGLFFAVIILLLVFASCGGGREPMSPSTRDFSPAGDIGTIPGEETLTENVVAGAPPAQKEGQASDLLLQDVLKELEEMRAPGNVNLDIFAQIKSALAEALAVNEYRGLTSPLPDADWSVRATPVKKFVSKPPTGEKNAVTDLAIVDNEDGTYTLTWTYRNVGDYNQDGVVNVSDITPLAQEFLKPVTPDNEWIDGNADGLINIGDITPLAENFFSQVSGYRIEGAETIDGEFAEILEVEFVSALLDGVLTFSTLLEWDFSAVNYFRVVPFDAESQFGEPSNVIEKPGELPPPPENEPPVARFSARPVWGFAPLPVEFDPGASYDPDGEITLYEWDFDGDGIIDESSDTPAPSIYTYETTGFYVPALKVTDDQAGTSQTTGGVTVINSIYYLLSGRVVQDNGYGLEGVTVTLTPGDITVKTDREGNFTFTDIPSGVYTLTPNRDDWSIEPGERTVYVFDENVTVDGFSAVWTGTGGRGDWYMFGRDRRHTARSPFVGPRTLTIFSAIRDVSTNPVFGDDGAFYVGTLGIFPEDVDTPKGFSVLYSESSIK